LKLSYSLRVIPNGPRALHRVQNRLDVNRQGDSADPTAKPLKQAAQVRLTRSKLMIETEQ
jgi:hypothetical protein